MKLLNMQKRTLALIGVVIPLLALFVYVALRSGPLAPVPVTVITIESRSISPALFGIGIVEARYTYRIGPTVAGRIRRVDVNVGDRVKAGQLLGEMDPVDLDDRVISQEAASRRIEASVLAAESQVRDTAARFNYADTQAKRYEKLLQTGSVAEVAAETKQQERLVAEASLATARANLDASRQDLARVRADREGLGKQRANLRLIAPVDGLVITRQADPGTTVVAGQAVIEVIDPKSLWINVRFNQLSSSALLQGLPAGIVLRSKSEESITGRILRVEPLADAVTEETLAKVIFDGLSEPLQTVGELAEVTVMLPPLSAALVVPNAGIQRVDGRIGVWLIDDGGLRFAPVKTGATDLDGMVQAVEGLRTGERVVIYSQRTLSAKSRVKIVDRLPGVSPGVSQ